MDLLQASYRFLRSLISSTYDRLSKLASRTSLSRSEDMAPKVYRFLVASYTDAIHVLSFDPSKAADKALAHVSSTTVGHHPSWVERHPTDPTIYFTGLEQADGRLITLKYSADSERVVVIGDIPSEGSDPCHIFVSENQVIVGNVSASRTSHCDYTDFILRL